MESRLKAGENNAKVISTILGQGTSLSVTSSKWDIYFAAFLDRNYRDNYKGYADNFLRYNIK